MAKKILLLGGTGLLGMALRRVIPKSEILLTPGRKELDLLATDSISSYILQHKPDIVINAAGLIDVEGVEKNPLDAWRVNALAPGEVARTIAQAQLPTTFIHFSTCYVFDESKRAFTEEDAQAPINEYGRTKFLGERLIELYGKDMPSPYNIVRLSWLYGDDRSSIIDFFADTLRTKPFVEAFSDLYGNPTYAGDLASYVYEQFIRDGKPSGRYHAFNSSEGVSRLEVAQAVAEGLGISGADIRGKQFQPQGLAPRPKSALLVNTKLPAMRSWRDALFAFLDSKYRQGNTHLV